MEPKWRRTRQPRVAAASTNDLSQRVFNKKSAWTVSGAECTHMKCQQGRRTSYYEKFCTEQPGFGSGSPPHIDLQISWPSRVETHTLHTGGSHRSDLARTSPRCSPRITRTCGSFPARRRPSPRPARWRSKCSRRNGFFSIPISHFSFLFLPGEGNLSQNPKRKKENISFPISLYLLNFLSPRSKIFANLPTPVPQNFRLPHKNFRILVLDFFKAVGTREKNGEIEN